MISSLGRSSATTHTESIIGGDDNARDIADNCDGEDDGSKSVKVTLSVISSFDANKHTHFV